MYKFLEKLIKIWFLSREKKESKNEMNKNIYYIMFSQ